MIFHSRYPAVTIPDTTLTSFVLRRAAELDDKPALIDGPSGRTLTYRQLAECAQRAAAGLAQRGFGKGDVFALLCPNMPEYAIAFFAIASLGGIVTTINSLNTVPEIANQINDAGACCLLTIPQFMDRARPAAEQSRVRETFVFGEAAGATPFAVLLSDGGQLPDVHIDPGDVVVLPYSSGTTGLSKGVMLTHRNLVANMVQMEGMDLLHADDVILGVLPFYHIYGMVVILSAGLWSGATIVTMPRFDLEQCLRSVQDYGVTNAPLVPPIILALAKHPLVERYNLAKLRVIISGAAPLGAELTRACMDRLGCLLAQGYGLTETSPVVSGTPQKADLIRPGASGMLLPNTECRVVDPLSGDNLGPNEQGEVCIRGPQVMKGYLNRPKETSAMLDADGWLHTGDIGYVDDEGYIHIVDRVKELIKYKAYQVAPAELEALLITHPAIADAAVIPMPDVEAGEVPKAFVVLKAHATPEEIMSFVSERVAPYKKIRALEVVDEIPKSAAGKILRRVLIEQERMRLVEKV